MRSVQDRIADVQSAVADEKVAANAFGPQMQHGVSTLGSRDANVSALSSWGPAMQR